MARLRKMKTPKANRVSVIRAHAMLNRSDRGRKARSAPSIPETETVSTEQDNKSSEEKHDDKGSSEKKPGNKSEPVIPMEDVANAQKLISDAQGGTQEAQDTAIDEAIRKLYPYAPHDGQRSALRHLIYTRKDLILIAKTSFGKSMILQAVSILIRKSITIVILPLNEIGKEQAMYITRIGGRPCLLNAETISEDLLDKLKQQRFTHVLLSPELAVGKRFRDVAIHPAFKQHLCMVVIDEAHLVSQWGKSFRTDYAKLSQLRCLLGADIPWFACSATLDPKTLIALRKGVSFNEDVEIQRTSINRPELLIRTGIIPSKCRSKGSALQFIFNEGKKQEAYRIPKTIVFFDSKKEAYTIRQKCREWLQTNKEFGYSAPQTREMIIIFHRDTAEMDKGRYLQELRRLGEDSVIRVIFATEALGVGVNLPDIRRVVQYGLPKSLEPAIFWQRSGRACRDGHNGEMILLMDQWVQEDRIEPPRKQRSSMDEDEYQGGSDDEDQSDDPEADSEPKPHQNKKLILAQRRGRLPNFWYKLSNNDSCLRDQFLDHFNEPLQYRNKTIRQRCCSNCTIAYQLGILEAEYVYNERGNAMNKRVFNTIKSWAQERCSIAYPNSLFRPVFFCFLPEDQITILAKNAREISTVEQVHGCLDPWPFFDIYGKELLKKLRDAHYECIKTPAQRVNQNHLSQSASQPVQENISWITPITLLSMSQPAPLQVQESTYIKDDMVLPTPLVSTPTRQPMDNLIRKRKPLGEISNNLVPKRRDDKKTCKEVIAEETETGSGSVQSSLSVSRCGRVRKPSWRVRED